MIMRMTNRLLPSNNPIRVCLTSSSSMSSSSKSTPATTNQKRSELSSETGVKKRESLRSILASIFGGYVDPANPNDPPIPADKVDFPDVVEQSTGEAKLFLLAFENGFLDPYCNLPTERKGRGTKDNPVPVESFFNDRIVGCVCETNQSFIRYTVLVKGEPKRCNCGHWLKLVDAPKFWEKIPKEDLITIPYFMELDNEGKLDDLLAGKPLEDDSHHGH